MSRIGSYRQAGVPIIHGYRYLEEREEADSDNRAFLYYMEPACYVSRVKTEETDSGMRDYRNHARTGCV
jgi:hypothetical protein